MVKNIYIGDLLRNTNQFKRIFKQQKKQFYIVDWNTFKLSSECDNLEILSKKLIDLFNSLHKYELNVIIDSFSLFIFVEIIKQIDFKNIKKIIIINPITSFMYIKVWTIKNLWLAKSARTMAYKQMYLFKNFEIVRNNKTFNEELKIDLKYIGKNDYHVNTLFNQILNYKQIKKCLNFINEYSNIIDVIVGDKNPMITKNDIKKLQAIYQSKCHIISEGCYQHFWESPVEIKKIIDNILVK